jgi:hypothetical protein
MKSRQRAMAVIRRFMVAPANTEISPAMKAET